MLAMKQVRLNGGPRKQISLDNPFRCVDTTQRILCDGVGKLPSVAQGGKLNLGFVDFIWRKARAFGWCYQAATAPRVKERSEDKGKGTEGLGQFMKQGAFAWDFRREMLAKMAGVEEFPSRISVGVFEDTGQFVSDSFAADEADTGCGLNDRSEGVGFDFKFISSSESYGSKHPEAVLADSIGWVSDRSEGFRPQVGLSADEIDDEVFQWIVEQAVDGKVASLGILFGGSEFDPIRTSSVGVGTIGAESGHFDLAFLFRDSALDEDDAESFSDRLGMRFPECTADLLGRGICGDIEIFGLDSKKSIANAAASVIGGKTTIV